MLTRQRNGVLLILMAACGGAFIPIFIRSLYTVSTLQPTDIVIWRFLFATPAIWVLTMLRDGWYPAVTPAKRAPVVKLILLGVLFGGAVLTSAVGLKYIQASLFVILFYTYPAMVALIAFISGTRLAARAWAALVLTLIGIVLTVPDFSLLDGTSGAGIGIALLSALMVAGYFFLVGRVMAEGVSAVRGTAWIITGTLLTALLTIPAYHVQMPDNLTSWMLLAGVAVFSTVIPFMLVNLGIQIVGAAKASIISTVEPVLTMILAMILLDEVVLPLQWLGAAVIIMAVILLEAHPPKAKIKMEQLSG